MTTRVPILLALIGCLAAAGAQARPRAFVPASADAIVERLPRGYSSLSAAESSPRPTIEAAGRLIEAGAAGGDPRLLARAEGLLAGAREGMPAVLRAKAQLAQHRHEFPRALSLLDRAIRLDPRDPAAYLARAHIHMVLGDLPQARADCLRLALQLDADSGRLCVAALETRRGRPATAVRLLDGWLGEHGRAAASRPLLRHALVLRAEAAAQSGEPAGHWFARAVALGPGDVRTLTAYARHLRRNGDEAGAFQVLMTAPDTDHVLLERAMAARGAGRADAAMHASAVAARFDRLSRLGLQPDAFDDAQFRLAFQGDARTALTLAIRNFRVQRDREDLELVNRAAVAARKPGAWLPIARWARDQGLAVPGEGAAR